MSNKRREPGDTVQPLVIGAEHPVYTFSPEAPAQWRVRPNVAIEVGCPDGVMGRIREETDLLADIDLDQVNPVTGPIWVEGAEPGDTLIVAIDEITIPQAWGYVLLVPRFGLLGHRVAAPRTMIVPIADGAVQFAGTSVPIRPCIGTIGVAPSGTAKATMMPGDHGGNLDTADICAGSRLHLRVNVPGALLALGDPKAVMGDGEVCGTGVGVPITFRGHVELTKGRSWPRPLVETAAEWQVVASAATLETACQQATEDMIEILRAVKGWTWQHAYMFLSIAGNLRISQVVDPLMTVRMAVSKEYLPSVG